MTTESPPATSGLARGKGAGFSGETCPGAARWETALLALLHPVQIAIVEALRWIGEPLSPVVLVAVFEDEIGLNYVSYHCRRLIAAGVLAEVGGRQVRGAYEHHYQLTADSR